MTESKKKLLRLPRIGDRVKFFFQEEALGTITAMSVDSGLKYSASGNVAVYIATLDVGGTFDCVDSDFVGNYPLACIVNDPIDILIESVTMT